MFLDFLWSVNRFNQPAERLPGMLADGKNLEEWWDKEGYQISVRQFRSDEVIRKVLLTHDGSRRVGTPSHAASEKAIAIR